jgi:cytochrome c-type biogenesis protein CcmH
MIDFWLAAGVLLLVALGFLLLPILRRSERQSEADRTALNVMLYQERLAELEGQQAAGVLSVEQMASGRHEAARELLADTGRDETPDELGVAPRKPLGRTWPLLAALAVPGLALFLYVQLGASKGVELAREFAQPPASLAQMTERLEQAVAMQPDSAEGLYFLGRAYMSENRPADAARLFERAAKVGGRAPALLGQWAQALFFAAGKRWSSQIQELTDEALRGDPREATSLGLLGISAYESGRWQQAAHYWQQLRDQLPGSDPSRAALQSGIDRALAQLAQGAAVDSSPRSQGGDSVPGSPQAQRQDNASRLPAESSQSARLAVRVTLGASVLGQVEPQDTVFVFARAVNGPPMPLAVRRLRVADLPAEVELGDAEAMVPGLQLSNFPEVQVMARVSRAGEPTRGEWVSSPKPVSRGAGGVHALLIDSPDH